MLKHDLTVGDEIWIGDTCVRLKQKTGQRVSLIINAPPEVKIRTKHNDQKQEEPKPQEAV